MSQGIAEKPESPKPEAAAGEPFESRQRARQLIAAALALNLLAIALAALVLGSLRDKDIEQTRIQSRNLAHAIEQNLGNGIDKLDLVLYSLSKELERNLRGGQPAVRNLVEHIDEYSDKLPETLGYGIAITDDQGRLIMAGKRQGQGYTAVDLSARPYFTHLRAHAETGLFVTKALQLYASNDWGIVLARRYNRPDGTFAGVVSIPLSLDYLRQMLSRYDIGTYGYATIRDRALGLVARNPPMVDGVALAPGSASAIPSNYRILDSGVGEETYFTSSGADRRRHICTLLRAGKVPFVVIVGLAEEESLHNWWQAVWTSGAFLLLFMCTTIVVARRDYLSWRRAARGTAELLAGKQSLEQALAVLQQRDDSLRAAEQIGRIGVFSVQLPGGAWSCSARLEELLGIDAGFRRDFKGWASLIHAEERAPVIAYFENEVVAARRNFDRVCRFVRADDGNICWMHVWGRVDFAANGRPRRFGGVMQDISVNVRAEERLRLSREAFINASEGIMVTDRDAVILECNPAFVRMSGYALDELIGRRPNVLKSGLQEEEFYRQLWHILLEEGYWQGEFHNRRKDGSFYIQMTRISAVRDEQGGISRFIAMAADVTELRESQQHIEYLAYHDKLTSLPNRSKLADRLQVAIAQADRRGELLGVCYLDLDGFKPINDEWGHDVGDQVLIEVAHRLQNAVRAGDTVARMGGDEFVVLLNNIQDEAEIAPAVQRLLDAVAAPYEIGAMKTSLSMSIGATIYPHDPEDADTLIRHADQAMYVAKRRGKSRLHLFDPESDRRLQAHHDMSARIAAGFERGEFRLYYQPQVRLSSGEVVGAEALLRWQHPQLGLMLPDEFLYAIDTVDFSIRFGEWIMRQVLAQMQVWSKTGLALSVSVNIASGHLQSPDFVERLAAILAEYPQMKPGMLELEILESATMHDLEAVTRVIERCADLGVDFALDDFGIGYSSLTYFRRLPTKFLKIDRSFVIDMLKDQEDHVLVASIIELAKTFNREVIAEGVETVEHGEVLLRLGCDLAQGFGIAMPMPPENLPDWVRRWRAPPSWRKAS